MTVETPTAAANRAGTSADRAEAAATRAKRASAASRGIAPTMPGVPKQSVQLHANYWGDRQREAIGEFMELLPLIELTAGLPPEPPVEVRAQMSEAQSEAMMNSRLTALLAARKIVVARVRKEI